MKGWIKGGIIGGFIGLAFGAFIAPILGQILNIVLGNGSEKSLIQNSINEIIFTFVHPNFIFENWGPWIVIFLILGIILGWFRFKTE